MPNGGAYTMAWGYHETNGVAGHAILAIHKHRPLATTCDVLPNCHINHAGTVPLRLQPGGAGRTNTIHGGDAHLKPRQRRVYCLTIRAPDVLAQRWHQWRHVNNVCSKLGEQGTLDQVGFNRSMSSQPMCVAGRANPVCTNVKGSIPQGPTVACHDTITITIRRGHYQVPDLLALKAYAQHRWDGVGALGGGMGWGHPLHPPVLHLLPIRFESLQYLTYKRVW
jgi:hypothetical protein